MNMLLREDTFYSFLLEEAFIKTSNDFTIDGHVNKEFYEDEKEEISYSLSEWSQIQKICFDLIKGKHTPIKFNFIMHLKPDIIPKLLPDFDFDNNSVDFIVSISFANGYIRLTSATSIKSFTLDKSHEKIWDDTLRKFLFSKEIEYEEL